MGKYKVGDVVVIRSDLRSGKNYGKNRLVFVSNMEKYRGMTYEISKINQDFDDGDTWYDLEGAPYIWCDDMFEGLAEDESSVTVVLPDTAEFNARLKTGTGFLDIFTYE